MRMIKLFIAMALVYLFIPLVNAENVTFNSSSQNNTVFYIEYPSCAKDNSTNITICANLTKANILKVLQYSEIFTNSTLNITISAPPFAVQTVYDPNITCYVNKQLNFSETFTNTTGSCNVTVTAPTPENITIEGTTPFPQFRNITRYNKTKNYCSVDLIIPQCPQVEVQTPPNYTFIEKDRKDLLEKYALIVPDLNFTNIELKNRLVSLEASSCTIKDDELLNRYGKLADFQKTYLKEFVKLEYPVTSFEFTNFLTGGSNQSIEDFNTIWLYADNSLKRYSDLGFAKLGSKTVYRLGIEQFSNETTYEPNITVGCMNKVDDLLAINNSGKWSGVKMSVAGSIVFMVVVTIIVIFKNRWYPTPLR